MWALRLCSATPSILPWVKAIDDIRTDLPSYSFAGAAILELRALISHTLTGPENTAPVFVFSDVCVLIHGREHSVSYNSDIVGAANS